MPTLSIRVDQETFDRLQALSEHRVRKHYWKSNRYRRSAIVREAIAAYLDASERPKRRHRRRA